MLWLRQLIEEYPSSFPDEVPFSIKNMHSILYTPSLLDSAKEIFYAIEKSSRNFTLLKELALYGLEIPFEARIRGYELTKLVIIDEAEKLKTQAFEIIRKMYDQKKTTFIFIGMPGLERIIERFPQLYSRIGFVHHFQQLGKSEVEFILEKHLSKLEIKVRGEDFTDQETVSSIIRVTNGNFRLNNRLLNQSIRIMKVNCMVTITKEIIEDERGKQNDDFLYSYLIFPIHI